MNPIRDSTTRAPLPYCADPREDIRSVMYLVATYLIFQNPHGFNNAVCLEGVSKNPRIQVWKPRVSLDSNRSLLQPQPRAQRPLSLFFPSLLTQWYYQHIKDIIKRPLFMASVDYNKLLQSIVRPSVLTSNGELGS